MQRGAFNYLTKPFDFREMKLQIERALENRRLFSEVERLKSLVNEQYDFANIIARSENMHRVLEKVSLIAKTDSTVYLYGESGTGKELIARAIHLNSGRRDRAFVAINCAAIPESLLESELFGYEKGAFTGADSSKGGLFRQAHLGTFFLDEIGDMSLSLQAKLLRVLQERQVQPLGGKTPVDVDVRVVCATNKNLEEAVKKGDFREDLYYRIHVIPIEIPPLRERKEDIPLLVEHFVKKFSKMRHIKLRGLTPGATSPWRQNMRINTGPIFITFSRNTISIPRNSRIPPTGKAGSR
jgi:two-component system response regulator GlrR